MASRPWSLFAAFDPEFLQATLAQVDWLATCTFCCLLSAFKLCLLDASLFSSDLVSPLQPDTVPLGAADDVRSDDALQPVSDLPEAASAEDNTLHAETETLTTAATPAPRPWRPRGVRAGRRHKKRHAVSLAHSLERNFVIARVLLHRTG